MNDILTKTGDLAKASILDKWIGQLLAEPEFLRMGHCQRGADLNLGMGWLYYGLARLIRPRTVVNIGSWRGFAPLIFGKALADNEEGGSVVFIDPSLVDDFWKDAAAVRKHFARFGVNNINHFLMTTQQFVETDNYRSLGEVGLVMVDGYHTAEQAQYDYEAFERFVPAQGVILLHDSLNEDVVKLYGKERAYQRSVKSFVDQLKAQKQLQVFDLPFAGGLTLVRKALA